MKNKIISFFLISLLVMLPVSLAQNFTYDADGNIISGLDLKYEYDGFNNLIRVNNTAGTILEEYTYDDSGNRLMKYEPPSNTTTYYLDDNLVRIANSSGTYDTFYYYDDQSNLLVRKDSDGSKFYYHPDHLGSTSLVTNQAGSVVEKTTYKPYGEVLSGGNDRFTFTGQELDDSGLMYYGARYYDPEIGKFTQPDTLLPDLYNPQALNRYSYVFNNPYKYVDEEGQYPIIARLLGATIRNLPTLVSSFIRAQLTDTSILKEFSSEQKEKEKREQEFIQQFINDPNYKVTLVTDVPSWKSPYYEIKRIDSIQLKEAKQPTVISQVRSEKISNQPLRNPVDVAKGVDSSQTTYDPKTGRESSHVIDGQRKDIIYSNKGGFTYEK